MSNDKEMKPRLLLVEDDAISRGFMVAALEAIPAHVDSVDTMAAALLAEAGHDAWLLDANLPDGSGLALLQALRTRARSTPALAHTADDSPTLHEQLRSAGFMEVLVKPLGARQLQDSVQRLLGGTNSHRLRVNEISPVSPTLPLWDESKALAALNGNHQHVSTLRNLFLDELPRQRDAILAAVASGDDVAARHQLHQLKASSGFVGAMRLNAAAGDLEQALADGDVLEAFMLDIANTISTG